MHNAIICAPPRQVDTVATDRLARRPTEVVVSICLMAAAESDAGPTCWTSGKSRYSIRHQHVGRPGEGLP